MRRTRDGDHAAVSAAAPSSSPSTGTRAVAITTWLLHGDELTSKSTSAPVAVGKFSSSAVLSCPNTYATPADQCEDWQCLDLNLRTMWRYINLFSKFFDYLSWRLMFTQHTLPCPINVVISRHSWSSSWECLKLTMRIEFNGFQRLRVNIEHFADNIFKWCGK